jgi:Co/Zn/Cd efflux system component
MAMFEHRQAPLAPRRVFARRMLRSAALAGGFIGFSLAMGAVGYHVFEGLGWLQSALNAAMILTGMGPVDEVRTTGGKVFAILYALYSGVAFLTAVAVLLAPAVHRFIHRFHLESKGRNP